MMALVMMEIPEKHVNQAGLVTELKMYGISSILITNEKDLQIVDIENKPDIAILNLDSFTESQIRDCARECMQLKLPIIALVPSWKLNEIKTDLGFEDFIVTPIRLDELTIRAKHILKKINLVDHNNVMNIDNITINTVNFEVSVNGKSTNLRFKEYELLVLMASNPGKVYSREDLLSSVWGYDYLGGTRTVDVHIRRLRSKIDDQNHSLIETVWNVGYRFKNIVTTS